ncbi:MAG: AAA-like domain-containing protein [Gloeotrichia echinulata GP01]
MSLVGGHPYLVRLALYYLVSQDADIKQLLKEATTDTGIYTEHLRRHLEIFQENGELGTVFKEIVTNNQPIKLERKNRQIYQLDSMGLIKITNNFIIPSCRLYQEYFGDRVETLHVTSRQGFHALRFSKPTQYCNSSVLEAAAHYISLPRRAWERDRIRISR